MICITGNVSNASTHIPRVVKGTDHWVLVMVDKCHRAILGAIAVSLTLSGLAEDHEDIVFGTLPLVDSNGSSELLVFLAIPQKNLSRENLDRMLLVGGYHSPPIERDDQTLYLMANPGRQENVLVAFMQSIFSGDFKVQIAGMN